MKCDLQLGAFPFDEQVCDIVVGCLASSRRFVDLVLDPVYTDMEHMHTAEFNLTSVEVFVVRSSSLTYAEAYDAIHYRLRLRRYPNYYIITFVLPMMSITLLAVATMWMSRANIGQRVNSGSKLVAESGRRPSGAAS